MKVLFTPLDAMGHFNASLGIAEQLRDRGHKVVFAVPDSWKNKISPRGFAEEWLNPDSVNEFENGNKLQVLTEIASNLAVGFQETPEEQLESLYVPFFQSFVDQTKGYEARLKEIVAKVNPDVIIADQVLHQPAIMDAGIPWILVVSVSPSAISTKNVPPAFTGYPTMTNDRSIWTRYRKRNAELFQDMWKDFKDWVVENGGPRLKYIDLPLILKYSPYANIYMSTEELDYTEFRPNPPNFHRFDTFIRSSKEIFEIPEMLKNIPGKLIYFSMGTIGCSELGMMKRLVSVLAKSPHRFIISKGPLADKYELGDSMWGAASVPQLSVIPLVDLVISHGGNNTLTETLFFGKPILVLPLFGDQPDNAQRVAEKGLGIRLHPYKSTDCEILEAIEALLSDNTIATRIAKVSRRMRETNSNSKERVADLVEKVGMSGVTITRL